MIIAFIIVCEIGFWALLAAGLAARYLLRRRSLGAVLLALTPVVDLALLIATAIDLRGGGEAGPAHGLAAVYLGFSLAYGRKLIRWADTWSAHRFAGGPAPVTRYGADYVTEAWKDMGRTVAAVAIAAAALVLLATVADGPSQAFALTARYRVLGTVLVVQLIWTVCDTIWPKKPRAATPH